MNSPLVEARIRDIQSAAKDRRDKREEAAAKREERETRSSVSPNDLIAKERAAAQWKYWCDLDDQRQARERQEKIKAANPTLIALKAEFMEDKTTPNRRASCVRQFAELYRRAYGKDVPVEVTMNEWQGERRALWLARVYEAKQ